MKTVKDLMKEENAEANIVWFRQMQGWTYDKKIYHAEEVAKSYYNEIVNKRKANVHVSVGGLDSQVLHYFLESLGLPVSCISCSSLEDKSNQAAHKRIKTEMDTTYATWYYDQGALTPAEVTAIDDPQQREKEQNVLDKIPEKPEFYFLKPLMSKVEVLNRFGWPVLSKETAGKIALLQNPTEKNKTVRHAIITGETGEYGGYQKNSRMKMSQKWLNLFGGADSEGAAAGYAAAPFKVSDKCCYYLKEKPCDDWAKKHNSYPYLGLMASEHGRREKSLSMHLCNYYGKSTTRSAPFAIFDRQDLLQLALDLRVPVPDIYGEIVRDTDGTLRTTKAQRTGCTMCGFGIHLEQRPHRFDRLKKSNPEEWAFWMKHVCKDESGEWYGWGRVLDYIGVGWEDDPSGNLAGQLTLEDICKH